MQDAEGTQIPSTFTPQVTPCRLSSHTQSIVSIEVVQSTKLHSNVTPTAKESSPTPNLSMRQSTPLPTADNCTIMGGMTETKHLVFVEFMQARVPRLDHLVPKFIAAGIHNENNFRFLAEWPEGEIDHLLMKDMDLNTFQARQVRIALTTRPKTL